VVAGAVVAATGVMLVLVAPHRHHAEVAISPAGVSVAGTF
jgi:hypothetical protein